MQNLLFKIYMKQRHRNEHSNVKLNVMHVTVNIGYSHIKTQVGIKTQQTLLSVAVERTDFNVRIHFCEFQLVCEIMLIIKLSAVFWLSGFL